MSNLAVFSFENSQVRTFGTADNPLFVFSDVCAVLQHSNHNKALGMVDPEDVSKMEITDSKGRKQTVNCVNESGLYALIFKSRLESAKRFKRWVTNEVLPAIRKQGHYECPIATITPAQHSRGSRQTCQGCVGSLPDRVPRALRTFPSPALHRNPCKGLRRRNRLHPHG